MFEPFKDVLDRHGHNFAQHLDGIRVGIAAIVSNTQAQLVRNQYTRKSVPLSSKATGELRNDSAYGWLIRWTASTVGVRVFIGTPGEESFMLALEADEFERMEWYLPPGGVMFLTNTTEESGFVNFEAEVMLSETAEGHTGGTDEVIDIQRREPVPSGTPLDTRTAA